ncbi:MAG: hypothetical protein J5817_04520 [Treponema sp.]|nr:hypothetical protein [Treponema sp.]
MTSENISEYSLFYYYGADALLNCTRHSVSGQKSLAFLPVRKQEAPRTARYLLAIPAGVFSQENSRVKMPRTAFLPAFQGYAYAPARLAAVLLRNLSNRG